MSADDKPDNPDNDPDDWIDQANAFCVEATNWTFCLHFKATCYTTSNANMPTISLPRTDKQLAHDDIIWNAETYLRSLKWPDNVADNQLRQWLVKAKHFFIQGGCLWYRDSHHRHKLVIMDEHKRVQIIKEAHDDSGHKDIFLLATRIWDRFWWPSIEQDIKWYNRSCHICQVCNIHWLHIPPMVPEPGGLFQIVHMDTMRMPQSNGFSYITQAHCSLSAWPEYHMLCTKNAIGIAKFIFEDILCHHSAIEAIVMDNGAPYIAVLEVL